MSNIWPKMTLHPRQARYFKSTARFNVVPAGRRSGKTALAKRRVVLNALQHTKYADAWYIMGAPTYKQARAIFWRDLKDLIPSDLIVGRPRESDMTVTLWNGAEISVIGLDKSARFEGRPIVGGVLDEYGNMKPEVFTENIRPSLTDRQGWLDFIGVPEGRNHYYDLAMDARSKMLAGNNEWAFHTWMTADVLPLYLGPEAAARELESARNDLDLLMYKQEYEASFVTFAGRVYYTFETDIHAGIEAVGLPYDSNAPIILCFDFNVAPGVAVICQEFMGNVQFTGVIGEVYIEDNSNTIRVCNKIIQDWGRHKGDVLVYGDATGGARGTAKVEGSDWDLIRGMLRPVFGTRLKFRVPSHNPTERVRVNAVNARFRTANGVVHMYIDPHKAPHVVKDFEGVQVIPGSAGDIDKDSDKRLTHLSDALGYYIVRRFPVTSQPLTFTQVA